MLQVHARSSRSSVRNEKQRSLNRLRRYYGFEIKSDSFYSKWRISLPLKVLGKESRKTMIRGYL